jgi:hypothetical protein
MDVESTLGEAEVWSIHTRESLWKGHNFWSDRLIAIKILQEFLEALYHGVDVELILGEEEVWSW